jgi:transcription antitermination protein NusB
MASRRRARQFALQALFERDLRGLGVSEALNDLWTGLLDGGVGDDRPAESQEVEFAARLAHGVSDHQEAIDALIVSCSINWRLVRMPVVDRNVLRLAAFELMQCPDIPGTVSVNEAVELAKRYGSAESRGFVNGIVDRMGRKLNRLGERGRRKPES